MNPLTHFKKTSILPLLIALVLLSARAYAIDVSPDPVIRWSTEARKAIIPPSAGPENYGRRGPSDAAVYMGIAHVAIYDAAVALEGGYEFYAQYDPPINVPPNTSAAAAIATAAHHTLVGLPCGLDGTEANTLTGIYDAYMSAIPDGEAKTNGIMIGERVAQAIVALRQNDGRCATPIFIPPPPLPGVWEPNPGNPPSRRSRSRQHHSSVPTDPIRSPARSTPRTSTKLRSWVDSTAQRERPRKRCRHCSGPIMTFGNGMTACSTSLSIAGSTWCRRRGCWRWRTCPGATP